ncbi:MAG: hypothetical protein M3O36_02930, partial [Myxococcota bacterium]|nr:hypothetical protein [Myxococcota bacterium]
AATDNQAILAACNGVLTGLLNVNEFGCTESFECANGAFCDTAVDGGLCRALLTTGSPCTQDNACSYAATQQPTLFCDTINFPDGGATCKPLLANGGTCGNLATANDLACAGKLCDGVNNVCTNSVPNPATAFICGNFVTDGGTD